MAYSSTASASRDGSTIPAQLPISLAGMRIGLVIYGDIEQRTGGNIYDRELLRSLATFGATWTLLNLRDPRSPHGVGESVAEILARSNSEDFDVLLQDELCHPALNEINAALGSSRRPLRVAIVHNLGYKAAGGEAGDRCKRSEREFLGGVHGCVANSQFTLREVEALLGASPPSVVAYPSVAPDLLLADGRRPWTRSEGGHTRLLSVANLSAVKGVHHLLAALAALRNDPWMLELVGSTSRDERYVSSIEKQIETLGLTGRVQLKGELRGAALRAAYQRADLLVLASPREGFGIVCLKAMRCGLPVVASTDGAAPELVEHEEHGLLVDPTDHRAFVATLRRVFAEPSLLPTIGTAAHARALRHPTWASTAARVAAFLSAHHSARSA